MKYQLYLDSRQSSGPRPSSCFFNLNQTINNAIQVKVLSFVFANTLFNVIAPFNTLVFSTVTITVPPGFYAFSDFITYINTAMLASAPFVTALGMNPNGIALSAQNTALWSLGTNVLMGGGLYSTFILQPGNYTASFDSPIFLAAPQALSLISPSLSGNNSRFATAFGVPISAPFYTQAVGSGFGEMEQPSTSIEMQSKTELNYAQLDQITVLIADPNTGREVSELSMWSLLLEIATADR